MSRQPDQNWLAICRAMHRLDLINNSRDIARFSSGCLLKYRYAVSRDSLVWCQKILKNQIKNIFSCGRSTTFREFKFRILNCILYIYKVKKIWCKMSICTLFSFVKTFSKRYVATSNLGMYIAQQFSSSRFWYFWHEKLLCWYTLHNRVKHTL